MYIKSTNIPKFYFSILLFLFILVFILALLLGFKEPNLIDISLKTNQKGLADRVNQSIKLKFSREIKLDDTFKVYFKPEILNFSVNLNKNLLSIDINEPLKSNSEYTLKLTGQVFDFFDRSIALPSEFKFTTPKNLFLYKNYKNDTETLILSNADDFSKKEVYRSNQIKKFHASDKYIVVIEKLPNGYESIKLFDYEGNVILEEKDKSKIYLEAQISSNSKLLLFSSQDAVMSTFLIPKDVSKLYLYNIENSTFNKLDTNINSEVMDFYFAYDNQTVVLKKTDGNYYLFDITNLKSNPTMLGRFATFGGFNINNTQAIFTFYDPLNYYSLFPIITIYGANRQTRDITDGNTFVANPVFGIDQIYYAQKYKDLDGSRGLLEIVSYNINNGEIKTLITHDGFSVELPKISKDYSLMAIEKYSTDSLMDNNKLRIYFNEVKPYNSDILIYDLQNLNLLKVIENAHDVIWM